VLTGESGSVEYEYDGKLWLASYRPIPNTGWAIIVQQPKNELLKLADEEAVATSQFIIFDFAVLVLLLTPLCHYTLKPLSRLAAAIRTGTPCRPGDFPKDEVGLLAGNINIYQENLEELVGTRTRELNWANDELRHVMIAIPHRSKYLAANA
jgi:C4-dicarboxylate-specific signal transduction histidine kinase